MVHLIKMKKLYLTLLFFSLMISCDCQNYGTVEGVVYDSIENHGIAFVNVYIPKIKTGTSTDTNGRFKIEKLELGEYEIEFSLIGYGRPKVREVKIYQDSTIFIQINLAQCEYDYFGQPSCPICNKTDETIPIVYGEPAKRTLIKAKKGKIWLGGCTISNCDPHWYCKRDKINF